MDARCESEDGPVAIIWDDIAAKNGLLYAPEMLGVLLYPHLQACCQILHGKGIGLLFHPDGDVSQALPCLVECGIDGTGALAKGTPEEAAAETRVLIDQFREDGNLLPLH